MKWCGGLRAPRYLLEVSIMKFSQEFTGVIAGEIYPRVFAPGEDCPPELLDAAKAIGAIEKPKAKAAK